MVAGWVSANRGRTEAPDDHTQVAGSRTASPSGGNISGETNPATSAQARALQAPRLLESGLKTRVACDLRFSPLCSGRRQG